MTANELIKQLQDLDKKDREKPISLIGLVSSDGPTRGLAELDHFERTDSLLLLVSEEAFTVKK